MFDFVLCYKRSTIVKRHQTRSNDLKRHQTKNTVRKKYVHYGCGLTAPEEWENYDISPTLRLQKIPLLGNILRNRSSAQFPSNVLFGNIVKGLPVNDGSCDGVYCSHVLEHLALNDFKKALKNTYKMLRSGGIFRCVVPDLEWAARNYIKGLEEGNLRSSFEFMENTFLGYKNRPRGLKAIIVSIIGNAQHMWMWDHQSLSQELKSAGFKQIRPCKIHDCSDEIFRLVEHESRFIHAVAIECIK